MNRQEFIDALQQRVGGASRTAQQGSVNALGRKGKPNSDLAAGELKQVAHHGLAHAAEHLWEHRTGPLARDDLNVLERRLFAALTRGINTTTLYRTHKTAARYGVEPRRIAQDMSAWMDLYYDLLLGAAPELAAEYMAQLEWELDFRIHPYADGCGRMTKCWSALFALRANVPLSIYPDRKAYYATMNQSREDFVDFYLQHCRMQQ